jgi:uncharacterized protein
MNIVVDTNVFVSYLLSPRGGGAWLMHLWSERKFNIVVSPDLFGELVEVLNRPEIASRVEQQRKLALFRRLRYDAVWTAGEKEAHGSLPDPDDDFLISAALEAEAEFVVSWDSALLSQIESQGVRIISPDQLISLVIRSHNDY